MVGSKEPRPWKKAGRRGEKNTELSSPRLRLGRLTSWVASQPIEPALLHAAATIVKIGKAKQRKRGRKEGGRDDDGDGECNSCCTASLLRWAA